MYQIDFNHPIHIHFIGIGGISMSGLASVLLGRGFMVSGSDAKESLLTRRLQEQGAVIHYGQSAANITRGIDCVVYTAAVHADNPEYAQAVKMEIPMLTRAELLGELMRNYQRPVAVAGTHGKTTTTSMLSHITLASDLDPTISVGGMLHAIGGNIRVGADDVFVAEACEYTNSFLSLFPKIGIILNIDADHLDFFKDLDDIRKSFRRFASLIPADGTLIINGTIENLSEITDGLSCKVITYGTEDSDYHAENIVYDEHGFAGFDAVKKDGSREHYQLSVPGDHNVSNALSVIACADILGIAAVDTRRGLLGFEGTERRFEHKGEFGDGVTVIDDYAHHPTEIRATLNAAQTYPHNTLWVAFQSHTYSRTKALMDEFASALTLADHVVLADIFPARETDNLGISSQTLQEKIQALGTPVEYFPSFAEIEDYLIHNCKKGDVLITMGAGDIVTVGEDLVSR